MNSDIVYIKAEQSSEVVNKKILMQDVAQIYSSDNNKVKAIENMVLHTVKGDKDEKVVFSIMKVVQMIQKEHPDIVIENIGEMDFIVDYKMPQAPHKAIEYVKLAVVCLIVFFGSAFTIMTFNTDVSVGEVFDDFYYLVMGSHEEGGTALEIAYSIGIPIGILGFYNHFKGANVKDDPTPIHIEMRQYEEEMNKAIISDASRDGNIHKT